MFDGFLENHRYTLMALLSAAILVGSGISLGVGLFSNQATDLPAGKAGVTEVMNMPKVSGVQVENDLSEQVISGKININTATVEELMLLPHIGATRAQYIVDYRERNNGFKSIEEIQNIEGIGRARFEDLKGRITVK